LQLAGPASGGWLVRISQQPCRTNISFVLVLPYGDAVCDDVPAEEASFCCSILQSMIKKKKPMINQSLFSLPLSLPENN